MMSAGKILTLQTIPAWSRSIFGGVSFLQMDQSTIGENENNFADAVATGSSSAESLFPDIFKAAKNSDWPSYVLIDKQFLTKSICANLF